MKERFKDGSAGDANYGDIGKSYSSYRQPEPRIARFINEALGTAQKVLNVGAGAGSYEPMDREITAVEPSESMRRQRPKNLSKAIDAVAENLPFPDKSFDAAMTTFSIHQWSNPEAGLKEMRRVTKGPIAILSCDPHLVQKFWLNDYAPGVLAAESRRYPDFDRIASVLGADTKVLPVMIPFDCCDGFNEAYYGRPEKFLEDQARLSCSAWSFVDEQTSLSYVDHLRTDLTNGSWDDKYGHLRSVSEFDGSLRLFISP